MPNESDQSTVYQEEYEVQIIDDNAEKEGSIKKGKLILQRVVLPALLLVAAGSAVAFQAGCYLTGIERRRRERWKEEREREKKKDMRNETLICIPDRIFICRNKCSDESLRRSIILQFRQFLHWLDAVLAGICNRFDRFPHRATKDFQLER